MEFTLLTYNIHKCIGGLDRRYNPERLAGVIRHHNPDLVLLQEVDDNVRRSQHHRQVDVLGDALDLRHRCYFPNVKVRGGGEYGNALLSRFAVRATSNVDVTVPPKKRRSVLHARLRVRLEQTRGRHARTLHVFNLHLGLSGIERGIQLRKFLDSRPFARLHHATPIVIAGDFNDVWGTLGRKHLRPAGFVGFGKPLNTFPAWGPARALDSIYVRGDLEFVDVARSGLDVAKRASDHLPLIARLRIT